MSTSLFQTTSRFHTAYARSRAVEPAVIGVPQSYLRRSLPRLAFAPPPLANSGDVLICIFQRGGMDGLSAVVPYGEGAGYYDVRPTIAVPEPGRANGAINLNNFFGLHPALAPLKPFYDAAQLAVVVATGGVDPTRSHFDAMRFMEQATPGNKTIGTGWLARHLETIAAQGDSPFRAVGFGSLVQASLRGSGSVSALALESIVDFHLDGRWEELIALRSQLESLYHTAAPTTLVDRQARLVFETIDQVEQLGTATYTPENGAAYAEDDYFSYQLKQCAQLIKADIGLEVACVDIGGWDTHETQGTNGGYFQDQLSSLAKGIAALTTDLGPLMSRVTIITMSEFGRRVEENGSKGTDHGHGNCMLALGGGVNGGHVYGSWPTLADEQLDDGDLKITTDQRHVLSELVTKRLKNTNTATVFPGYTPQSLGIFKAP